MPVSNSHNFVINRRFLIIPKEIGFYHSFPTLIKVQSNLILAFRSGKVDKKNMHGSKGRVRLFYSNLSKINEWKEISFLLIPDSDEYNELDAIISYPNNSDIFLATRNYDNNGLCRTWLSKFKIETLLDLIDLNSIDSDSDNFESNKQITIDRKHLKTISNSEINSFGHIVQTLSGGLLMSGYTNSPVILSSNNQGNSWEFRSQLYDNSDNNALFSLSEFSLAHVSGKEWVGLMRNEVKPNNIILISSKDDCATWQPFSITNLTGHAPMVLKTKKGEYIAIYRELIDAKSEINGTKISGTYQSDKDKQTSQDGSDNSKDKKVSKESCCLQKNIAIAFSNNGFDNWKKIGILNSYSSSLYDGGYGDIVEIDENLFLAVYYICDNDNSPWIEGVLFSL